MHYFHLHKSVAMIVENKSSAFQEFEIYETFTDKEIFTKIWTEPRRIFNYIEKAKYEKYFYILMVLAGITGSLDRAMEKGLGNDQSIIFILISATIFGGLLGWIGYYIYAALISWTGKWLDGKGNTESIYRVMAYALIPSILSLLVIFSQILIFGSSSFQNNFEISESKTVESVIFIILNIGNLGLAVVNIIFYGIAISVVQKFGIEKAILNLLLPILIIVVPILILIFLIFGVSNIF